MRGMWQVKSSRNLVTSSLKPRHKRAVCFGEMKTLCYGTWPPCSPLLLPGICCCCCTASRLAHIFYLILSLTLTFTLNPSMCPPKPLHAHQELIKLMIFNSKLSPVLRGVNWGVCFLLTTRPELQSAEGKFEALQFDFLTVFNTWPPVCWDHNSRQYVLISGSWWCSWQVEIKWRCYSG